LDQKLECKERMQVILYLTWAHSWSSFLQEWSKHNRLHLSQRQCLQPWGGTNFHR